MQSYSRGKRNMGKFDNFKESLKKTLGNFKEASDKILKDIDAPLKKMDEDMKKSLGDLY
jgi:hypothetical protein